MTTQLRPRRVRRVVLPYYRHPDYVGPDARRIANSWIMRTTEYRQPKNETIDHGDQAAFMPWSLYRMDGRKHDRAWL